MKQRRWGLMATSVVAALALVSGCTGGGGTPATTPSGSGEQITISFLGRGQPEEEANFKILIAQFEAKFPNVKVDYTQVPPADFTTKLQTMIAAHQTPDVFYLYPESVMPFAQNGIVWDMTDYVAKNDLFKQDNIWPKALDMYRYDGKTPGVGALYGLPKDIGPFALAYNKDLFAAAGIPTPDPKTPWTWDQFVQYAKQLTSGDGANKVFGTAPYSLESAVWSNGADWLNATHDTVTITDPKFTDAMQWVADLVNKHHVAPSTADLGSGDTNTLWLAGRIGMMGVGPWVQTQFWADAKFNWDIMPWPVPKAGDKPATWYGGIGLAVSNESKHKDAAANLAAFLAFNEDSQRTAMQLGQSIPNLIDMTQKEWMTNNKPPASKQVFIDIIQDWGHRATQTFTYTSDWFGDFNTNAAAVWNGETTAVEFAAKEAPVMQDMLTAGINEQKHS